MNWRKCSWVALLALPLSVQAGDFGAARVSQVLGVHDADTFRVNIQDWPAIVGRGISVRVAGIDAPELRGRCAEEIARAQAARQFAADRLAAGTVELKHIRRDKYFRLLAEVWIGGESLGDALIQAGLARPYDGGTKQGWCAP